MAWAVNIKFGSGTYFSQATSMADSQGMRPTGGGEPFSTGGSGMFDGRTLFGISYVLNDNSDATVVALGTYLIGWI